MTTKTKPWRSGFCNKSNPTDSHERCNREHDGMSCCCECHTISSPALAEPATEPDAGEDIGPGIYLDLAEPEYHGHTGSLSHSGAKVLLKAPALFKHQQEHRVTKSSFDFGSAAHAKVLGKGIEQIVVVDADSWRTKAAQEIRDKAHAEGKSPVLKKEWDVVLAMAKALEEHPLASELLRGSGAAEVSMFAIDETTGVLRRCRFDWITEDRIAVDYKSTADASPESFAKSVISYGYDMQAGWYSDVAEAAGEPVDEFCFVVQEKEPPYLVEVYDLSPDFLARGRARNRRALDLYAECVRTDTWPGYTDRPFTTLTPPAWATKEIA